MSKENLELVIQRYQTALEYAKKYQANWKDEDYEIHLEYREPTSDASGFIKLRAEDLEFYNDDLIKVFPDASSIRIEMKEIELEYYSEFQLQLTLFYKI